MAKQSRCIIYHYPLTVTTCSSFMVAAKSPSSNWSRISLRKRNVSAKEVNKSWWTRHTYMSMATQISSKKSKRCASERGHPKDAALPARQIPATVKPSTIESWNTAASHRAPLVVSTKLRPLLSAFPSAGSSSWLCHWMSRPNAAVSNNKYQQSTWRENFTIQSGLPL